MYIETPDNNNCLHSNTNFQLSDYDTHTLSIAEEIDPGSFDVRSSPAFHCLQTTSIR